MIRLSSNMFHQRENAFLVSCPDREHRIRMTLPGKLVQHRNEELALLKRLTKEAAQEERYRHEC